MAGISSVLAELDRMKRVAMRRGKDWVADPVGSLQAQTDVMRNFQRGAEPVITPQGAGLRQMPREQQVAAMSENALDTVGGGLGTFIARGAKNFDSVAAAKAKALLKQGKTPEQIWNEVPMNWVLPHGGVVQEIDDSTAKIIAPWLPNMAALRSEADEAMNAFKWAKMRRDEGAMPQEEFEKYLRRRLEAENAVLTPPRQDMANRPLSQFLEHPELYENYPHLKQVDLATNPHTKGSYQDPNANLISIGTKGAEEPQGLLGVTMHEVGHDIQQAENLPRGGGPELFAALMEERRSLKNQLLSAIDSGRDADPIRAKLAELKKNPAYDAFNDYDAYRSLMGEQLSDVTAHRVDKDMDWRRMNFPGHDMTTPIDETLWRNMSGTITAPPMAVPWAGGYGGKRRTHF